MIALLGYQIPIIHYLDDFSFLIQAREFGFVQLIFFAATLVEVQTASKPSLMFIQRCKGNSRCLCHTYWEEIATVVLCKTSYTLGAKSSLTR